MFLVVFLCVLTAAVTTAKSSKSQFLSECASRKVPDSWDDSDNSDGEVVGTKDSQVRKFGGGQASQSVSQNNQGCSFLRGCLLKIVERSFVKTV